MVCSQRASIPLNGGEICRLDRQLSQVATFGATFQFVLYVAKVSLFKLNQELIQNFPELEIYWPLTLSRTYSTGRLELGIRYF